MTSPLLLFALVLASTMTFSLAFAITPVSVNKNTALHARLPLFGKSKSASPLSIRGGAVTVPGWKLYNDQLDANPLVTKSMTSLVGWALGDYLAQTFIGSAPFNMKRFIRLAAFGLLYHGPSGHYFYNWLDSKIPGTGPRQVATKVAIDQLLWCPLFMTVFFT